MVIAVVLSLIVAGLVIGEVYMRGKIKECVANSFNDLGAEVEVGLSPNPVLLQLLGGKIDYVTLKTTEETTGTVKGLTIDARIDGIETDTGATEKSDAVVTWSTQGILETLQAQQFGSAIVAVQSNTDGTLRFEMILGIEIVVRVTVVDQELKLEAVSSEIFGFGLPEGIVDGILGTLNENLSAGDLPFGLKAQSVDMDAQGLTLYLKGDAYTPPAEDPATTTEEPSADSGQVTGC